MCVCGSVFLCWYVTVPVYVVCESVCCVCQSACLFCVVPEICLSISLPVEV